MKVIKVFEGESEVERFEASEIQVSPKTIVDDVLKDIKNLKVDEHFSDEGVTFVQNKQIYKIASYRNSMTFPILEVKF